MENKHQREPGMASCAVYRITVKGKLSEHWEEWINGSTISLAYNIEGNPNTILTCQVKDQAQLLGILNRINSLNLPLLQVNFIEMDGENRVKKQ